MRNTAKAILATLATAGLGACMTGGSGGGGAGSATATLVDGAAQAETNGSPRRWQDSANENGGRSAEACSNLCNAVDQLQCTSAGEIQACIVAPNGCLEFSQPSSCPPGTMCTAGGCVALECKPNCDGKACGDDGCGNTCKCAEGSVCEEGVCKPPLDAAKACEFTTFEGCCDGGKVYFCDGGQGQSIKCAIGKDCGWTGKFYDCTAKPGVADPSGKNPQACVAPATCKPNCTGKTCGPNGCGGVCGSCSAGQACEAGKCLAPIGSTPDLLVNWKGLMAKGGEAVLPGWLAHLYGKNLGDVGQFDLCTLAITNPDTVQHNFTVEVEVIGYTEVHAFPAKVAGKTSWAGSVGALTWKPAWHKLSSPATAQVQVRILESGKQIDLESKAVSLHPVNSVIWDAWNIDGAQTDGEHSVVTLASPADKAVLDLLSVAKSYSVFKSMKGYQGKGSAFGSGLVPAIAVNVAPGAFFNWPTWYDKGDKVEVSVAVTCSFCTDYNAVYEVADSNGTIQMKWANLGKGLDSFSAPAAGWYVHSAKNPAVNGSNRQFTVLRKMAVNEITQDQVGAIFLALKNNYGLGYVTVSGSYFGSAQYVKLPKESLSSSGANCIDGSLVFVAALEAMGMQPYLYYPPGHALVGVRCWPGAACFVPVETTEVGTPGSTFIDAINAGIKSSKTAQLVIDVKAERAKGYVPIPWG